MARDEQYKMAIDAQTRQPLELYDLVNDSRELRNLVNEPSLESLREGFLNEYFSSQLLANLDKAKLKVCQRVWIVAFSPGHSPAWAGCRRGRSASGPRADPHFDTFDQTAMIYTQLCMPVHPLSGDIV